MIYRPDQTRPDQTRPDSQSDRYKRRTQLSLSLFSLQPPSLPLFFLLIINRKTKKQRISNHKEKEFSSKKKLVFMVQ